MKSKFKLFSRWGFKQQVLCLALIPPITISLLLGVYFISIRLGELSTALHDRGNAVATRLASQGEYGLFAGDASALRRLAQREINEEISSVAFYDKDGIEVASAGNLTSSLEPPRTITDVHVIVNQETNDVLSFITPVTLPEVIIDDDLDSVKLVGENNLKSTIIGWLKVEVERRTTKLKSYQVFIQSCMIVFLGVCMSFLLAMRLDNKVSTPILRLIDAVKKIRNGQLGTRVNVTSGWELQILQSGVNVMASTLQRSHIEMQKNIDQATSDLRKTLETIEIQNIELEEARNKAEAANKVKSEFLANMSHELRTPLNAINGFVGLIQKTTLTEQQYDYIKTIETSSKSLVSIINDILDFSKFEAGKVKLYKEEFELRECVEETLAMLAPSAHEKDLELINFIYDDVPERVVSDKLRLKQVITNLVNNAIKFTEAGSVVLRVMVEQKRDDDVDLCFSVTDTGIGLTSEQKGQLFHAFSQANPNIAKKFGGTGLGLVICKKIISQMGGEIDLDSMPQRGSTFWFTVPVATVANSHSHSDKKLDHLHGRKVLVFDRNKVNRAVATNILKRKGVICKEEDTLENIISYLKKEKDISLVILGVNNSLIVSQKCQEIIKEIKSHGLKVIVVANTTEHAVHGDLLGIGADGSMAKPLNKKKFVSMVDTVLSDKKNKILSANKPSILAVDDNFANMKLLTVLLKNLGAEVTTANNGLEAVKLCKDKKFNIIFMDINMPVMDGLESTMNIRKDTLNKDTPIIALSAHIQSEDRALFISSGLNDTITKPILEHELKAILYKWSYTEVVMEIDNREESVSSDVINYIDWSESLRIANNNEELAYDMLSMLCGSIKDDYKNIVGLMEDEQYESLYNAVHKVHGGCCYCGVPQLREEIKSIEISLKNEDYNHIDKKILSLAEIIDNILLEYEQKIKIKKKISV